MTQSRRACPGERGCCCHTGHPCYLDNVSGVIVREQGRWHTGRRVVADGVDGLHAGQGTSAADLGHATDFGGASPDELREVTPLMEVTPGVGLAVAVGRELAELSVVPHVAGSLGAGAVDAERRALGTAPEGEVLAIAAATRRTRDELAGRINTDTKGKAYRSCSNTQREAD